MGLPVIGLLVKGVSNGIGVASEAIQANKNKKANLSKTTSGKTITPTTSVSPSIASPPPPYEETEEKMRSISVQDDKAGDSKVQRVSSGELSDSSLEQDEEDWALDEATETRDSAAEAEKLKYTPGAQPSVDSLVSMVVAQCTSPSPQAQLQSPVILPQRRPGSRGRGFIRAYAPDLADNGISQEAFLSFLNNMDKASQASPILTVISVSAGIAGFIPDATAFITSTVVQVAVGAAIEMQRRQRTNNFLDKINHELFQPRGLYAMVMQYNPKGKRPVEAQQVSLSDIISKRSAEESGWKGALKKPAHGTTYGEVEMPEAAELIFPSLDEAMASENAPKESALKTTAKAMGDYYDRRAQATYATRNPGSSLANPGGQQTQFASRFSDPNHAVNSGSIFALVSGGHIDPGKHKKARKQEKRARKQERRERRGKQPKRRMKTNVLYLMIVNMPTEEELAMAKEKLGQA